MMSSTTGPSGSQNAHASQQPGSAPATLGTSKAAVKPIESLKMKIIDEVADGAPAAQGGDRQRSSGNDQEARLRKQKAKFQRKLRGLLTEEEKKKLMDQPFRKDHFNEGMTAAPHRQ